MFDTPKFLKANQRRDPNSFPRTHTPRAGASRSREAIGVRVQMTRAAPRKRMSRAAKVGLGCGAVLLIALLGGLFIIALAFHVPPSTSQPQGGTARSEAALATATEQIRQLEDGASRGVPAQQMISVSQEDINSLIAARSPDVPLPPDVQNVNVEFANGIVRASAMAQRYGRDVYVEIAARPHCQPDGTVHVTIESGKLGRLPLPGNMRREIEAKVNAEIAKNLQQAPVVIESVATDQGVLTVVARTRPRSGR